MILDDLTIDIDNEHATKKKCGSTHKNADLSRNSGETK
jgi:hypothetical protein